MDIVTPHLREVTTREKCPLWLALLTSPEFRLAVQRGIAAATFPEELTGTSTRSPDQQRGTTPTPMASRPSSALSSTDRERLRCTVEQVGSVAFNYEMWLSKCRWKPLADRYWDVSRAAASLKPWPKEACPSPSYFQPANLKCEPLLERLSVDIFLHFERVKQLVELWWKRMPKTDSSGHATVGQASWIQLHSQIHSTLLHAEVLQTPNSLSLLQDIAARDWHSLCPEDFAMGKTLFGASILFLLEPWMETTEVNERVSCLEILLEQIVDFRQPIGLSQGDTTVEGSTGSPHVIRSHSPTRATSSEENIAVANRASKVLDELDLSETHKKKYEGDRLSDGELVKWRGKLRQLRAEAVAKSVRRSIGLPRRDVQAPAQADRYMLERVLLQRLAHAIRDEVTPGVSLVDYSRSKVIPRSAFQRILFRHPTVVDELRATVDERSTVAPRPETPSEQDLERKFRRKPQPSHAPESRPRTAGAYRSRLFLRLRQPSQQSSRIPGLAPSFGPLTNSRRANEKPHAS